MTNIFAASMLWRTKTTLYSWRSAAASLLLMASVTLTPELRHLQVNLGAQISYSKPAALLRMVPHIGVSGPDLSAVRHLVRIATEYQIQDFDVFSIRLKTHCPVGAKPSVEI